ncbi:hypothetical protein CBER1_02182 [Cercospora berteroae]|uniref:Transcription factor domain-containing protein n=1 Tax=Cercospora berteroae TaxID=357750 RepID=A0A2S6BQC7_9PEZI|nr:hypothetical protein CBER1_02182 [Cercospora berteroae]
MELLTDPLGDLVLESVAFQVFLLAMGSWSRLDEVEDRYAKVFWTHCKRLSQQLSSGKDRPPPRFSPVFGMDFEIVTAMIDIKRCFARTISHKERQRLIANVQAQLDMWSHKTMLPTIENETNMDWLNDRSGTVTDDLTRLVILAISIFLEHLTHDPLAYLTPPRPSTSSLQLQRIIPILESRRQDPEWSNSYLGLWPVWTVGIFMQTENHIELIRDDLQRRWNAVHMSVINRYREDLENVWRKNASYVNDLDELEELGDQVLVCRF